MNYRDKCPSLLTGSVKHRGRLDKVRKAAGKETNISAAWFEASFLRRPWSQGWWFNSHLTLVVASLDKMLHNNYLCLVESNKQQIEEVTSKFKRKTRKQRQLLNESGFVLCIAPLSLSRDRRINSEINKRIGLCEILSKLQNFHLDKKLNCALVGNVSNEYITWPLNLHSSNKMGRNGKLKLKERLPIRDPQ